MQFNYDSFLSTLPVMAKGMAGIFIVTAIIIAVMFLLTGIFGQKKK